jgi:hypothetical protein
MRKQELIHLHSLFAQTSVHYESRTGGSIDRDRYAAIETRPTSIQESKGNHKDAVFALIKDITAEIEGEGSESARLSAD